jgi:nitrous oxide reductase accessory protein NosL
LIRRGVAVILLILEAIGVTDYYRVQRIDAHKAYYVVGSDVLGPMGHELIPLETRQTPRSSCRIMAASAYFAMRR